MNTRLQKYVSFLFVLFAGTAFAVDDPFAYTGRSIPVATANTGTPAASAPEAAKPSAPVFDTTRILHCAKNYGRVILDDQPSPVIPAWFVRVNLSSEMLKPIMRHAAKQAGCFTLVDSGTPGVKLKLKVETAPPTVTINQNTHSGAHLSLWAIPFVGGMIANSIDEKNRAEDKKNRQTNWYFADAMVTMTVINTETGEPLASVYGQAKSEDTSLGAILLSIDTPDILAGEMSNNLSIQVIATEFADGFNKLVPAVDKLNSVRTPVASSTK